MRVSKLTVLDLVALALGPALVEPDQNRGPVAGLAAARPGIDFDQHRELKK